MEMLNDYEKTFENLIANLKFKKVVGIENVILAFEFAKEKHEGQFRKDGAAYISHPVEVAAILEKQDFDTDMIASGLLHDVIEDCGVTKEELSLKFNVNIATQVDAVSAISKFKGTEEENIYFDENFPKFNLEDLTYKKLLTIGKKNKLAFYIKLADRLHNLKTIESFDHYKQFEKVKETERWILPIAKILKSYFFYYSIKNECFKIMNRLKLENFEKKYDRYFNLNEDYYKNLKETIAESFRRYFIKNKLAITIKAIYFVKSKEEDVFKQIRKNVDVKSPEGVKQSHFNKVPTMNIFIILLGKTSTKLGNSYLLDLFGEHYFKQELVLTNFAIEEDFGKGSFVATDKIKNKYRVAAFTYSDYIKFINGTIDGSDVDLIDENYTGEIVTSFINVKTRSGEVISMQDGATALDFAFRIHNDIGFGCKHALINSSPNKSPLYTKLNDGDKVNIIVEKDANGRIKNNAELRWFAYVKTENAQRSLIKYFEKKIKE